MMMKKVSLAIVAAVAVGQALAMPSKAELDKVSPVVQELMKPIHDEMRSGKKTRSEVADAAMELVAQAKSEAAKFLLIKGAYGLYVRDGNFDAAIKSLQTLQTAVADVPAQNLANIIESSLRTVSKKNGGQLYRLLDETKNIAKYQDGLKRLNSEVKRDPTNKALQTSLAEHHAVLGNWTEALKAFVRGDNKKAAEAAKAEQGGAKNKKAIADFWWDYPSGRPDLQKGFQLHAAELYSEALAANKVVGLYKAQVEKRIAEVGPLSPVGLVAPVESTKNSVELGGVQLWENGPYWAECNVGASKPEESGYYFWWGDTVGYKRVGDRWDAVDGSQTGFSFNVNNCPTSGKDKAQLQSDGYIDATGNLTPAHDAATAHLGAPWRMPTDADFAALIKNCDTEWTTRNGVAGKLVKGKGAYAGKSIFLPASGRGHDRGNPQVSSIGYYFASTSFFSEDSYFSWDFEIRAEVFKQNTGRRFYGLSVRPVRGPAQ